jgi:hypothetical protein
MTVFYIIQNFEYFPIYFCWENSVCDGIYASTVYCWLAKDWTTGVRFPTEAEDFPCTLCSQPALGSTQPPVQWVPGVLSPGLQCGRSVMLTIHPLLVSRLGKRGAIPLHPPSAFMACSGSTLLFTVCCTLHIVTCVFDAQHIGVGSTNIIRWYCCRSDRLRLLYFRYLVTDKFEAGIFWD